MVTRENKIEEVIGRLPGSAEVFLKYGLDCAGCQIAEYESIDHAARVYGINIDMLLRDLNNLEQAK